MTRLATWLVDEMEFVILLLIAAGIALHAFGTHSNKKQYSETGYVLLGALALAALAPAVWVEGSPCAALYFGADFGRNAALGAGVLYFLRSIKGQAAVLLAAVFLTGMAFAVLDYTACKALCRPA